MHLLSSLNSSDGANFKTCGSESALSHVWKNTGHVSWTQSSPASSLVASSITLLPSEITLGYAQELVFRKALLKMVILSNVNTPITVPLYLFKGKVGVGGTIRESWEGSP